MQETIQGITIVKAFTMEKQLKTKVETIIDRAENRANRIARLSERTAPMTETFAGFAISSVLAYAAFRTIYNGIQPGAFFAFVTALLMAYDPARRLARLQVSLERAVVNARMIYEILDTVPHQRDLPGAGNIAMQQATIEFRDVRFGYNQGDDILKGVSFVAEGGKTTALVGPSGAGKSTVISLIPRFYDLFRRRNPDRRAGHRPRHQTIAAQWPRLCFATALPLRRFDPRQYPLRTPGSDGRGGRGSGKARLCA